MKYDLKKITFIIPFYLDHDDRIENARCVLSFLYKKFRTNIIFVESMEKRELPPFSTSIYDALYMVEKQDGDIFHRTKVINAGIRKARTPFIAIYDTDCIFEPMQIVKAYQLLEQGCDVAYPYDGRFMDIDREYITTGEIKEHTSFATGSVGGAVFMNREKYIEAGLENEFLVSHAPEDAERYHRLLTLGYRIARIEGKCYHITHWRGINSGAANPHHAQNMKEYEKVKAMNAEELQQYINTWEWAK